MLNDTETPSAPLDWAEPIHGELVLVDRVQADGWQQLEPGEADEDEQEIVPGVLAKVERGAGTSFVIKTPAEERPSKTGFVVPEEGGLLIVTHLAGDGGPDIRVAARDVPDDAYASTEASFDAGFVGVVLFDGASSWEMASEHMLYVFAEIPKGTYAVDVSSERTTEAGKRFRVIRLRRT